MILVSTEMVSRRWGVEGLQRFAIVKVRGTSLVAIDAEGLARQGVQRVLAVINIKWRCNVRNGFCAIKPANGTPTKRDRSGESHPKDSKSKATKNKSKHEDRESRLAKAETIGSGG